MLYLSGNLRRLNDREPGFWCRLWIPQDEPEKVNAAQTTRMRISCWPVHMAVVCRSTFPRPGGDREKMIAPKEACYRRIH